jgi:hypothetical protein
MAIVIRHRCEHCGALWEGSGAGASPWIRCASCRALLAFDWQAFFESDAYKQMMMHAAEQAPKWSSYTALSAEGAALAQRDPRAAQARFHAAAEIQLTLSAFAFPPEAQAPGRYREGYATFLAWWQLQCLIDPLVAPLQRELTAVQQQLDYQNPMPTLQKCMELLRQQFARLEASDAPPDPDGMTPSQRYRVAVGMVLGAYLPLLSPSARLTLLRQLYGKQNVAVQGDVSADDLGLYFDWTCSACGLTSLQGRMVTELVCMGCFFRRPFQARDTQLPAVTTRCTGCGAQVSVGEGALQATCSYCHAVSTRLGRTGSAERSFVQAILAEHGGMPPEPASGTPGLPVNASNRTELVLSGLARVANAFGSVISPERYASVARPSLKLLGLDAARGLAEVKSRVIREGGGAPALKLVEGALPFLSPPRAPINSSRSTQAPEL